MGIRVRVLPELHNLIKDLRVTHLETLSCVFDEIQEQGPQSTTAGIEVRCQVLRCQGTRRQNEVKLDSFFKFKLVEQLLKTNCMIPG